MAVREVTTSACEELGVPSPGSVCAELYKLLLYKEGSFFRSHRDTEKADGMFGTRSIMLPSSYEVRLRDDTQPNFTLSCILLGSADCS